MSTRQFPRQRASDPTPTGRGARPEAGWGSVLRVAAARTVLVVVGGLLLWSVLPVALGWTPRLILSGSMEPRVQVGDVIVTREAPAAALDKGNIVTVADPDHPDRTRTHRVVERDAQGRLVLKGDANREADSSPVPAESVLGVGVLRVPFVGRPAYWMAEGNWWALVATAGLLGWCVVSAFPGRRRGNGRGPSRPTGGAGPAQRHRGRRVAAAAAAGLATVSIAAGPAEAAFRATTAASSTLNAAANFYPYRTVVRADSPYLYWRLDETAGAAVDDSGTGNRDGTLVTGTAAWGQAGALASEVRSKALSLSSARINANTPVAAPATFSVEAWFRSTSTQGGRILGIGNATGSNWSSTVDRQLYLAPNGRAMFGVGSGTGRRTIQSTSALNDGEWHHVVGTRAGGNNGMKLYVDGVLQGSATASGISLNNAYWRAGAEQMSGWTNNPTSNYLAGELDELAVYTTALSATKVANHYAVGTTP